MSSMSSMFEMPEPLRETLNVVAWPLFLLLFGYVNLHLTILCVYRLLWSPVAKIPGHDMSGATYYYRAFFDSALRGKYIWKLSELHDKWGPVIRSTPIEVSIDDHVFMDAVFSPNTIAPSHVGYAKRIPTSKAGVVALDMSESVRTALKTFVQRLSPAKIESATRHSFKKLLARMNEAKTTDSSLELRTVFNALVSDILIRASFGVSPEFVDDHDFGKRYYDALTQYGEWYHWWTAVPLLRRIFNLLPMSAKESIIPGTDEILEVHEQLLSIIVRSRERGDKEAAYTLVDALALPANGVSSREALQRAYEKAMLVITGEADAMGRVLAAAVYELLQHPSKAERLRHELDSIASDLNVAPDPTVARLPYLRAVLLETIRRHPPAIESITRVNPGETFIMHCDKAARNFEMTPGIRMSMSPLLIHYDISLWHDPNDFLPERFLEEPGHEKYLLPFGKSARAFLPAESSLEIMAVILAGIFRKYGAYSAGKGKADTLDLYCTKRDRDVDIVADLGLVGYSRGNQGIRVLVQ